MNFIYQYTKLKEEGVNLNNLMERIKQTSYGLYRIDDSKSEEIDMMYIIQSLIGWQRDNNKGIIIKRGTGRHMIIEIYDINGLDKLIENGNYDYI